MADHPRRVSTAPAVSSIPPAPPPPPPPYRRRDRAQGYNAIAKFISQPFNYAAARPASPASTSAHQENVRPHYNIPRIVGPLSSQNATHRTGLEINALDISPNGTRAILAGREILKTILVDGTKCVEEFNLLSAMRQYASHNSARTRPKDALDIHDVKWSHGPYDSLIATAASSGRVVLYDLNRTGVELARLHEHPRQVHKLAFNPHHGALLLSGSQDGTTKLWDVRDLRRDVGVCPSQYTHNGQADGVRDVKWSPTDGFEFAFGTDSGIIQRWDYRQIKGPKLKINAHNKPCHAIDWHPDGKHLVSASSDKTLRFWNFATDARRQKPSWTLQAPYPVHHVRWRPPCKTHRSTDQGNWQCTHLVTSYDRDHSAVHVWDIRRPSIPFRELVYYNAAPTDLLWHSQDLLWTVGREGVFNQTDTKFEPKPAERRTPSALAFASYDELTIVSQQTERRTVSNVEPDVKESSSNSHTPKGLSPEKDSVGRTSIDDSIDEGFLSSSFKKRHGRSGSNRSIKSISSTPPSHEDVAKIIRLDEMLPDKTSSQLTQITATWAISNPLYFTFLAHRYSLSLPDSSILGLRMLDISDSIQDSHINALRAGMHRIAQSWKILNHVLAQPPVALTINFRQRQPQRSPNALRKSHVSAITGNVTPAKAFALQESSSNVTTPLARPRNEVSKTTGNPLPDPDKSAELVLPPSLVESSFSEPKKVDQSQTANTNSKSSPRSFRRSRSNEQFNEKRIKMTDWHAQPKTILNLEPPPSSQGIAIRPLPPNRHDSTESFPMFSASTDSRRNSFPSSSSSARSHQRGPGMNSWKSPDLGANAEAQSRRSSSEDLLHSGPASDTQSSTFQSPSLRMSGIQEASPDDSSLSLSDQAFAGRKRILQIAQPVVSSNSLQSLQRNDITRPQVSTNSHLGHTATSQMDTVRNNSGDESRANSLNLSNQEMNNASAALSDLPSQAVSSRTSQHTSKTSPMGLPPAIGLLLPQMLSYHSLQSPDAQSASQLLLLLAPLVLGPEAAEKPMQRASLHKAPITDEQAQAILAAFEEKLSQSGIKLSQAEAILSTYHDQLISLRLFHTATQLRCLCFPLFPSVYESFLYDTNVTFLCQTCKNPITSLSRHSQCTSCGSPQHPCPICWSPRSPYEDHSTIKASNLNRLRAKSISDLSQSQPQSHPPPLPPRPQIPKLPSLASSLTTHFLTKSSFPSSRPFPSSSTPPQPPPSKTPPFSNNPSYPPLSPPPRSLLWTTCILCGHAAHSACHRAWFTRLDDGGCPTPGCLCDCAKGEWRDAKGGEREQRVRGEKSGGVRGDAWGVRESRAVGAVRGQLADGQSGGGGVWRRVRVVDPGPGVG
ncbi:MAG: SEA (Seh1-associated) complex subunit [Bogoriella megaspora]|nr:MAG: SEA (Seh1-associated) complex subunit [Bogoriella megaspora]